MPRQPAQPSPRSLLENPAQAVPGAAAAAKDKDKPRRRKGKLSIGLPRLSMRAYRGLSSDELAETLNLR